MATASCSCLTAEEPAPFLVPAQSVGSAVPHWSAGQHMSFTLLNPPIL